MLRPTHTAQTLLTRRFDLFLDRARGVERSRFYTDKGKGRSGIISLGRANWGRERPDSLTTLSCGRQRYIRSGQISPFSANLGLDWPLTAFAHEFAEGGVSKDHASLVTCSIPCMRSPRNRAPTLSSLHLDA